MNRGSSSLLLLAVLLGVLALLPAPAPAQLPLARLNWVHPPGARAGATPEVTVGGTDLDEPVALRFSDPRLAATPKPGAPNVFVVQVPPEVPAGLREVRFMGRFGVSNPRVFAVGSDPELTVVGAPTSPPSALDLPLDTVANGRTPANDVLWFRFSARSGQRLLARVEARELDSRLLPELTVTDPAGHELSVSRRQPLLDFTAPAEGPFLLKLHDQTFRGGEEFFFRLTIATGPHVDFAVPNVLRAGTTNEVVLFGRHFPTGQPSAVTGLDGTPLQQLRVAIVAPSAAPSGPGTSAPAFGGKPSAAGLADPVFQWPGNFSRPLLRSVTFALTTNPVFRAEPPPASQVVAVTPPADASFLFPHRGELAGATFAAKKGDVWWIELIADRTGPNADPAGVVQRLTRDANGETKASDLLELGDTDNGSGGREFEAGHRDASARFQAPEDGDYRVLVRDLFRNGPTTPRLPCRVQVRRESPGFTLAAFPQPPPRRDDNDRQIHLWSTAPRRGETLPFRVITFRQDGFAGDIELSIPGLPAGLAASPARIPAGQSATTLLLTARSNAPAEPADLILVGRALIQGTETVRTAAVATARWHVPNWELERGDARLGTAPTIGVVAAEEAVLEVVPAATNRFEIPAGGKLSIPLRVVRRADFPAAFNLKPSGHPELDKAKELAVPEKATEVTWELNLAETKLPEGEHVVGLQGFAAGKYRNNPQAAEAAERAAKAAAEAAAQATGDAKPAAEKAKADTAAAAKAATDRAQPRDVTVRVYSPAFVIRVKPSQ